MGDSITKRQSDDHELLNQDDDSVRNLVLHNDDINTFDHVIDSLVDICRHDPIQAEQCAFITHCTGKCDIKKGDYKTLYSMRKALLDRGLQVTID